MSTVSLDTDHRQQLAARAWNLEHELVLIGAGGTIPIPGGGDQCFPYRPHPDYRWLSERRRAEGVLAYDPREGWTLFEPGLTEAEEIWGGGDPPVGRALGELDEWLSARRSRPIAALGVPPLDEGVDEELSQELAARLLHARRPKDTTEIEAMRRAAVATEAGFMRAHEFIRPGVTERGIQIELECGFLRAGGDGPGYGTTVGIGPNSAVFHHQPGYRIAGEHDLVLIDAGAEADGYVVDVTRTFPSGQRFTGQQQALYDAVLHAEEQAIAACLIGTEWLEVHRTAAQCLAVSLRDLGLVLCAPEDAVDSGLIGLFFPHGVGHMVGLGVRDATGPAPGRGGESMVGGVRIRMDLPLQSGYVVTVEPGLYFIPALLQNEERRARFRDMVAWDRVEPLIGLGGIRIEDSVLITPDGPQVLTGAIPKDAVW